MRRESNDPCPACEPADRAALGLDVPDEEWLARVRRATSARCLGQLGGYELLEEISRGAQGVVYRAWDVREARVVAVKRLLAGTFATGPARGRFEREMETAAALQHPNIVRVLGMESAEPHPLLIMEWIDGVPIHRWADEAKARGRDLDAVLGVFLKVCDAVHHAHQRGVIHRDLKPSNVLVDANGEPHLLDFGLAKLTTPGDLRGMSLTGTSDFLGTPAYAAPEQVRGDHQAVDVRTDGYALGVILFRILTARLPFDYARNLADLLASIQQDNPARPSSLNRSLNDEIDAIIGKAMAKEADRRYASVDALAADLRRFLGREPVEAQRGRRWYEWRTTIRRHRTAAITAGVFLIVVTGAVVALTAMYARQGQLLAQVTSARDAEAAARHAAQRQQQILESLLAAAAGIGQGTDLAVRRAWLDEATRLVEAELLDDPKAQAAAYDAIGRTYQSLALYPEAEDHLRTALDLRSTAYAGDHPEVAASLAHLGELLQDRNRFADAEPFLRTALAMRQRLFTGDHPDVAESLNSVGLILQSRHEFSAAEAVHRQALEMRLRLHGEAHPEVAYCLNHIGNALLNRSQFAAAEVEYRRALDIYRGLLGDEHRDVAATKVNLGKALFHRGHYAAAEPLFREAVASSRRLLGDGHDNVAWGLHRLGLVLHAEGEYAEAEAVLSESLSIYRRCFGDRDPYVAAVLNSLGTLLLDRGDAPAAKPLFDEALAIQQGLLAPDDPELIWQLNRLAEWYERAGRFEEAEPLLRQALAQGEHAFGSDYPSLVRTLNSLARVLLARSEYEEAETLLAEALETRRAKLGEEHPDVGQSLVNLGSLYRATGRLDQAAALIEQGIDLQRSTLGGDHPELARSLTALALVRDAQYDGAGGEQARAEALAICQRRECPPERSSPSPSSPSPSSDQ